MQVLPESIVVYVDAAPKDNAMCTVAFRDSERLCACARINAILPNHADWTEAKATASLCRSCWLHAVSIEFML